VREKESVGGKEVSTRVPYSLVDDVVRRSEFVNLSESLQQNPTMQRSAAGGDQIRDARCRSTVRVKGDPFHTANSFDLRESEGEGEGHALPGKKTRPYPQSAKDNFKLQEEGKARNLNGDHVSPGGTVASVVDHEQGGGTTARQDGESG